MRRAAAQKGSRGGAPGGGLGGRRPPFTGVLGRSPGGGLGGRSPPKIFEKIGPKSHIWEYIKLEK